ncbi:TetR/AcrR family transcriptional regulator C-terminal domain-containing protein [Catenuloplanes atrovinosus]|uniref:DNA-binding transcriptional regulator YhcF (GntR family) n=1 Tax=Catenuloplanes atrovinosus TaxID=137266 RepID=A0AAE3YXH5_9ACTN|nr:TetR/AcrR family transcriptional regulator C-terminal domain-containing protein [Catenuloplanes atrovinosus]MDR7280592.1 DNA-binding transcriptional regulator YhcF (GntR family) [Catenuloplanes atrovinosus]
MQRGVAVAEEPPFQRIVTELGRRIRDGELAPGDRVPSTRRIAREWGVAMATATKALTTLRHLGLVRTEPRSGTIVADRADRADRADGPAVRGTPRDLTRERVVRTAIELADAEGLDALSMRAIAARLGAATMSTYRHVADKDELTALMADAAYGEIGYPEDEEPLAWRPRIERAARALWTLYRRHPWLPHVDSLFRPLPLPNLLAHDEQILRALDGRGLTAEEMLHHSILIYTQVQSLAMQLEREAQAQSTSGISGEEWVARTSPAMAALMAEERHPVWSRMMAVVTADGFDLDLDALFELGLRTTLDGLEARMAAQPGVGRDDDLAARVDR